MSSIQVIKSPFPRAEGTAADLVFPASLPPSDQMTVLSDLCLQALEKAEKERISVLDFPPIPAGPQTSAMFQAISLIYRAMRSFQSSHSYPETICICCEDDHLMELYMMVWNLYYAQGKDSRMNDGRWD